MKLLDFLKNKRIYVFSILSSFYLAYLFCRLWDLNILAITVVTLFIVLISVFLTYLWHKKIDKINKISKKKKKIVFAISVFLSVIIVFLNFNFFALKSNEAEIQISSDQNPLEIINNIFINNQEYYLNADTFTTDYDENYNYYNNLGSDGIRLNVSHGQKINDDDIIIKKINGNSIYLKLKKSYNIKINFKYTDGTVNIKEKNINRNAKFVLNETNESVIYNVSDNFVFDSSSFLRTIISLFACCMLCYLVGVYYVVSNKYTKGLMITFFVIFGIGMFYFSKMNMQILYPDSGSYINFDFHRFLSFKLNDRTPIYPIFIEAFEKIFKTDFLSFICIFQYLLWGISIIYLYKIIYNLTSNTNFSIVFSVLYALSPTIISWCNVILTESIAISLTMIVIYYIVSYIKTNNLKNGYIVIGLSFFLTFHRPTSLIYLFGFLSFLILKVILSKKKLLSDIKCLIYSIVCLVFVVIYAVLFHNSFKIYSLSYAMVRQDLIVSIREGYYASSSDKNWVKDIDESLVENPINNNIDNIWVTVNKIIDKYDFGIISKNVKECRKNNIKKYIKYIKNLYIEYGKEKFEGYGYRFVNPNEWKIQKGLYNSFSILTFLHVYIIMLIQLVLVIKNWIVYKKTNWINLGLFAFPFVIILSSFIGTCSEFMRTAIACVPFTYVSLIYLINMVFEKKDVK